MSQLLEQRSKGKYHRLGDLLSEARALEKKEDKVSVLKRLCSSAYPIYDISGYEMEAMLIMVNMSAGELEKILHKSTAKKNLRNEGFLKKSLSCLEGALTHNGKLFDSTLRSRLLVLPDYDPDDVRVHSGSISQGRDIGYAYNSNLVRAQKWLLTPFIYRNKRHCLAQLLGGKSNQITQILTDLGLDDDFSREIRALFKQSVNKKPGTVDGTQIIVQDNAGNDLVISPLCSHLVHSELQNRLQDEAFYRLSKTVNVGSPLNAGGYGNLVSDSGGKLKQLAVKKFSYLSLLERFYHQVDNGLPVFSPVEIKQLNDIEYETYEHNKTEQESEYLNLAHMTTIRKKINTLVHELLKPVFKVRSRLNDHEQWLTHYKVLLAEQMLAKSTESSSKKLAWLSLVLGNKRVSKVRKALIEKTLCQELGIVEDERFSDVIEESLVLFSKSQLISTSSKDVIAYVMDQLDSSLPENIKKYIRNDVERELSRVLTHG